MELNQIFSGRQTCQVVQASNLFRDRLHPHHHDCDMIHSWFMFVKQNVVCLYPVETTGTHRGLGKISIFVRPKLKSIQSPLLCVQVYFKTAIYLHLVPSLKNFLTEELRLFSSFWIEFVKKDYLSVKQNTARMGEIKNQNNPLGGKAKASDSVKDFGVKMHG